MSEHATGRTQAAIAIQGPLLFGTNASASQGADLLMKFLAAFNQGGIKIDRASPAHLNLKKSLLARERKHLLFHDRMRKDEVDEIEHICLGRDLQIVGSRSSHDIDSPAATELVAHIIENAPIALGELESYTRA